MAAALILLTVFSSSVLVTVSSQSVKLADPELELCINRDKSFYFGAHWYSYSLKNHGDFTIDPKTNHMDVYKYNFIDARNYCRRRCMETVSIETQEESHAVNTYIWKNKIPYIWTSGHLCVFPRCKGLFSEPLREHGWVWLSTNSSVAKHDNHRSVPAGWWDNPWSPAGLFSRPQPDNVEEIYNGHAENCISIVNDYYDEGIKFHDTACHRNASFICEDSDHLLNYVAQSYRRFFF